VANLSIEQWASEVGASLADAAKAIKLEVFTGVIDDTRVDTGRLKGNWQTTQGQKADGVLERTSQSGSESIKEAEANVTSDGVEYLTNNLEYAPLWEEKDGMIARNLARVETIVRKTKK